MHYNNCLEWRKWKVQTWVIFCAKTVKKGKLLFINIYLCLAVFTKGF